MNVNTRLKILIGVICVALLIFVVMVALMLDSQLPDPIFGIFQTEPSTVETQSTTQSTENTEPATTEPQNTTEGATQGTENTQPATTDPTGTTEGTENTQPATTEPTGTTEETENTQPVTTEPTGTTEETENTQPVTTEPTSPTEETLQETENTEPVTTEPTSPTEETTQETENTQPVTTEPTSPTEETTQETENTEPVTTEPTDATEGTEDTQPVTTEPTDTTEETESSTLETDDTDPTDSTDEPPPSVEIPPEKDPDTGEDLGVSFPCQIPGYDMTIEKMGPYSGMFVEDGTNTNAQNVAMLLVRNNGDTPVEYTQIRVMCDQEELLFDISALPAGQSLVVQEKNGKALSQEKATSVSAMVVQRPNMEMSEGKVQVTDNGDNTLTVKNLTGETIPTVRIFYKYYMEQEQLFVGGIAFTVRISRLGAGASVKIQPSHYTSQTSRVVMVLTYDSEV